MVGEDMRKLRDINEVEDLLSLVVNNVPNISFQSTCACAGCEKDDDAEFWYLCSECQDDKGEYAVINKCSCQLCHIRKF